MTRFWTEVAVAGSAEGWSVSLDDRPVRTPAGRPLVLPTEPLAQAIAAEWSGVEGKLDPARLRLTGLANAALDHAAPDSGSFAETLAPYADTDLLCYRAEGPAELVARQAAEWEPPLVAFADRYAVEFVRVAGVMHVSQPTVTRDVLVGRLGERDGFGLAALSVLVTTTSSLVLALLLADHGWHADVAWSAATLDEHWQAERWGGDEEAEARLAGLRTSFDAAARMVGLLGTSSLPPSG